MTATTGYLPIEPMLDPTALAQMLRISERHLNLKLIHGAYPDRPYDSPAIWGDATKIQSIIDAQNQAAVP